MVIEEICKFRVIKEGKAPKNEYNVPHKRQVYDGMW
jgi:hypothetical protein